MPKLLSRRNKVDSLLPCPNQAKTNFCRLAPLQPAHGCAHGPKQQRRRPKSTRGKGAKRRSGTVTPAANAELSSGRGPGTISLTSCWWGWPGIFFDSAKPNGDSIGPSKFSFLTTSTHRLPLFSLCLAGHYEDSSSAVRCTVCPLTEPDHVTSLAVDDHDCAARPLFPLELLS